MYNLLKFLESTMPTPYNWSPFHTVFFILVATASVLLCVFMRNCSEKTYKRILLGAWITILSLEIYKQIVFTFTALEDGTIGVDFQWYSFPFQLCSTPLYVLPIAILAKNEKVRDVANGFLSFFSFFGGLAVMIFPGDVFISYIGINVQTMVHHGTQVIVGLFIAVWNRKKICNLYYLKSVIGYGVCLCFACILNETLGRWVRNKGESFNMFYISHAGTNGMPILSSIQSSLRSSVGSFGNIVFFFIYALGFIIVGYVMYWLQYGFKYLKNKKEAK